MLTHSLQLQRDTILSAIEDTKAGDVSYTALLKHILSVGGVSTLIVLATQFPALGEVVLSRAKPGLDLLK
jgi:hypothetical protein